MTEASSALALIQSIDIVDEVQKYVKLKPSKQELLGLCPFHTEDTPSFYVNPSKQLFYCFGCQQGGNVINFRAKISGLTLQDALEALAKDYHIQLKREPKLKGFRDVLSLANEYYQERLKRNEMARSYLYKRNLSDKTIEKFEIGYAESGWNNLNQIQGFSVEKALDIGLMLKGDKGTYDRFRKRIIFPIRSHQGQLVGFGGRAIGDEKPKYINSSDSAVYHKSELLYGLYQALKESKKDLIVVEGYMDVISLHQVGFEGAVASLGTAFTVEQFQLISKYAKRVTFCFDGDLAGRNAALKAFHTILPYLRDQLSCYFLILEEDDPDAYIQKHGKEKFEKLLLSAKPLSKFLLEDVVKLEGSNLEDKARYVHEIRDILVNMPNSILKRLIIKEIGGVPKKDIIKPVAKVVKIDTKLVSLMFNYASLIRLNEKVITPLLPQLPNLVQKAYNCILNEKMSLAEFLIKNSIDAEGVHEVSKKDEKLAVIEIADLLKHYQLMAVEEKIKGLMKKDVGLDDGKLLHELLKVKHLLKKKKIILESEGDL